MQIAFAIALVLHALVSTLVGLLYGAMLPMFARRPIVLGGLIGPVLWSGLLYSMLGLAESSAREPHRLALVHGFAGGLWRRRGIRRGAAAEHADAREPLVRYPRRSRSSRNYSATRERRGAP